MSVDTLKIYEILNSNLPEEQAKTIAKAINTAIEADTENKKELLATKVDLANAKTEIITTILKWMFIFWLSQIGVISGIIFAMLKLYFK
ncbi:MAG: hypothetical protein COZ31_08055 [Nitrospirae bacterium CG_4_10_14_3_um_filter_44_29]|nr:hypothetical protein [Nitrospirota bacterium]PIV66925.1 MAG: hypothetical protein COS10_03745 [Nitrospirae bacterium CG01_land_8_20_14_3_00_44_22]PIX87889.1 MAG: hypothetical protein COZ31_08055 [Nitrospirae bacterium CG_4_10_14_3_um_filter_44_29]